MAERTEVMTDYQFKALLEMFKGIVRELKDPEKAVYLCLRCVSNKQTDRRFSKATDERTVE